MIFTNSSLPKYLSSGRIAMDDAVFPTDYVALDLETTGFYPNSCAITEIGAVTHVFVNDPTRGYGIFIENMLQAG